MSKFVYVFSQDARDILHKLGYTLLKSDDENRTYIFANKACDNNSAEFELSDVSFILSDTLTF